MNIYIAGKITGDPSYKEKFQAVEDQLKSMGHIVMNPAILPEGFPPSVYMKICLSMLEACDGVYLLPDWDDSNGARIEHSYAMYIHKHILWGLIGLEELKTW